MAHRNSSGATFSEISQDSSFQAVSPLFCKVAKAIGVCGVALEMNCKICLRNLFRRPASKIHEDDPVLIKIMKIKFLSF